MARVTQFVSDLSGNVIEDESELARIQVTFADARRGMYTLDVTVEEGVEIGQKGRKGSRRGRKPGSKASSSAAPAASGARERKDPSSSEE